MPSERCLGVLRVAPSQANNHHLDPGRWASNEPRTHDGDEGAWVRWRCLLTLHQAGAAVNVVVGVLPWFGFLSLLGAALAVGLENGPASDDDEGGILSGSSNVRSRYRGCAVGL